MSDRETAWLIEGDGVYWTGKSCDARAFGRIDEALRFARQQDAECVKHWLLEAIKIGLRVTEHMWIDSRLEKS